jgi:hypothetical protein
MVLTDWRLSPHDYLLDNRCGWDWKGPTDRRRRAT